MIRNHHYRLKAYVVRAMSAAALCVAGISAATADTSPTQRQLVQHLLRRFAFSAPPSMVDQVVKQGGTAWLSQQLDWQSIDDTHGQLNHPPTGYLNPGSCNQCLPNYNAFEAMVYQHDLLTKRQVQAKLELHWLDHFSVSQAQIDHPSMYNYDAVVRANALGNFAHLVAAVAVQPAMMWWLNNDGNMAQAPNVNWARELMQLYTIGEWQLNPDGSQVLDKQGNPIPNYAESDIKAMAKAMSGYHAVFLDSGNPMANYLVVFNPQEQLGGHTKFLGATRVVPNNQSAITYVVNILAHHPSAAPFQVTELLKRFVTETPSPQYIADIVKVWVKYDAAPDQIAKVVAAIVAHPDFAAAYHSMPKQPIEQLFDAMRALPGEMQTSPPSGFTFQPYEQAGQALEGMMQNVNQDIFGPPNVFSFYLPGHLLSMTTTVARIGQAANINQLLLNSPPQGTSSGTGADTWIDLPILMKRIGSESGPVIAKYLLDALVDGGSPGLRHVIQDYLGERPSTASVEGAVWLIINSPEYAVN
jgi:uncharacterized protein (DUF1800 family)